MRPTSQKPASPSNPKLPTGGAERQRSGVRREAVRPQVRFSQPQKAGGLPTLPILKALPSSSILPPILHVLTTKNLEYPVFQRQTVEAAATPRKKTAAWSPHLTTRRPCISGASPTHFAQITGLAGGSTAGRMRLSKACCPVSRPRSAGMHWDIKPIPSTYPSLPGSV